MLHKVNESINLPLSTNTSILNLKKGQIRYDLESLLDRTELVKLIAEGFVSEYTVTIEKEVTVKEEVAPKAFKDVQDEPRKNKKGK